MSTSYDQLRERVDSALREGRSLNICGAGTKKFYGREPTGDPLDVRDNRGIIEYDPSELVIVARAGTPLLEIEQALAENRQMLGFEPPFSRQGATIGGAVASGLAGAGRPYLGAVRDYLLGVRLLNGKAEVTGFGGKVMKNVAGFDLFRPMAGAMGTLGVLLEVSLRVIPIPDTRQDLVLELENQADVIGLFCRYSGGLPSLSAAGWHEGRAYLRLSGSALAVERDRNLLSEQHAIEGSDEHFRISTSEFSHEFFDASRPGRVVAFDLAPATPPLDLEGDWLIDWGGARRYLRTSQSLQALRASAAAVEGFATQVSGDDRGAYFHPLDDALLRVQQRLKLAFDPEGIFNPGRMYSEI